MALATLATLGITLPAAPKPIGSYVPAVRSGQLVFLSGQLPFIDGKLPEEYTGKLGYNVSVETGQAAARQAVLNALAILDAEVGLAQVRRIVRLAGYVSSTPIFSQQPAVLNGASELLVAVFGEAGIHARLALGAPVLPLDACLEIELIVEVA
ncbi:MAG TPA: RidA family protein [Armatimonadota bacterium]|jgi:enamine deaminase RidA (YjgF/YER057c/UK114 family)